MDAVLRAGTQVAQLDPIPIISAMAASKTLGSKFEVDLINIVTRPLLNHYLLVLQGPRATYPRFPWLGHLVL
jgi:hypothetical protein